MINLTAQTADKLNDHTAVAHYRFCGNGKDDQKHGTFHGNTGDGKQITDEEDTDQHACRTADQNGCTKQI